MNAYDSQSPQTIRLEVATHGAQLWLRRSGQLSNGSENLRPGRLVQQAIEDEIEKSSVVMSEVVVDYSNARGAAGDSPVWSVVPALRRGLRVRLIASDETYDWLSELLAVTNMNQLIELEMHTAP
ncbi:MAG: hypothetical protein RIK87_26685 [Fuerstiella sp.]